MTRDTIHDSVPVKRSANSGHNDRLSLREKLSVFAGGGAVATAMMAVPAIAEADIVQSSTAPIGPPPILNGFINWDVDGDWIDDFQFRNYYTSYVYFDDLNSGSVNEGGRLVVPFSAGEDGISKLPAGLQIGPMIGTAYKFHTLAQSRNSVTNQYNGGIGVDASLRGGWSYGDTGFFGFKFTKIGGDTHYGWGEMTIDDRGSPFRGANVIINRAYYNDTAGAGIIVGAVPEPSSVALLAIGVTGLATWRRRRKT